MQTIAALFESDDQAASAMSAVKDAGIPAENIALVTNSASTEDAVLDGVGTGAQLGSLFGGVLGLLIGLTVEPYLAGAWILGSVIGALGGSAVAGAFGGVWGALGPHPAHEAHAQVTVKAPDERAEKVSAIMFNAGATRALA